MTRVASVQERDEVGDDAVRVCQVDGVTDSLVHDELGVGDAAAEDLLIRADDGVLVTRDQQRRG